MSNKLVIEQSASLGIRGVTSAVNIKKNSEIERCPIILLPKKDWECLKKTAIWKYYYEWNTNYHALVLGFGSLYNHSYKPNARYCFNFKTKEYIVKALKNIKAGEEIFVNYNYEPDSKDPLPEELTDYDKHRK